MKLDTVAAVKITTLKVKMEQGNLSNVKWFLEVDQGSYKEGSMALTRDF